MTQVHAHLLMYFAQKKLLVGELDIKSLIGMSYYLEIYYNLVDVINIMFLIIGRKQLPI